MAFWAFDYDPWKEMKEMQRRMDQIFTTVAGPESKRLTQGEDKSLQQQQQQQQQTDQSQVRRWRPLWDVRETDKDLIIHSEIPGVNKEDVSIKLENGLLTVSGEKKHERKEENEQYHVVERSYGSFSRSLRLPERVDPSAITATFNNGVLEITVPKPEAPKPQSTQIPIK